MEFNGQIDKAAAWPRRGKKLSVPFARRCGMYHSQSESFAKDNSPLFKTLACHRVQT